MGVEGSVDQPLYFELKKERKMLAKFKYLEEDTKYWIVSAVVCFTILTFVATSSGDISGKSSFNHEILQSAGNDNTLIENDNPAQFELAEYDPDKLTEPNKQY